MELARFIPLLLALGCGPADDGPAQAPDPAAQGASRQDPQDPAQEFVVDLRPPEEFVRRHIAGSVNLQWEWGQFEIRVVRLFPAGSALRIVGADDGQVRRAVAFARKQGFAAQGDTVDFAKLPEKEVAAQATLDVRELERRRGELLVLDARTAEEYAAGHVRAALFVYPDDIRRIAPALRKDHPIAVICEGGWRSSLVVSWLQSQGFGKVYNVIGGMAAWREQGLPVEKGSEQEGFK